MTYLSPDGRFRLSRGNKGTLFVLVKDAPPAERVEQALAAKSERWASVAAGPTALGAVGVIGLKQLAVNSTGWAAACATGVPRGPPLPAAVRFSPAWQATRRWRS